MATYNNSTPYDFNQLFDEPGVTILVGSTSFDLVAPTPGHHAGKTFNVPVKEFLLTAFAPLGEAGASQIVPCTEFSLTPGADYFIVNVIKFSGEPVPEEHMADAQKLEADGYYDLFQIVLSDGVSKLYLKMDHDTEWQGNVYEGTGIKIEGVANHASEEVSRPKLTIFNPEGVYSSLVDDGLLDGAKIIRYRVLKYDVDNDRPVYRAQQWKVSRVASLRVGAINLELRDLLDGQTFMVPYRMFMPPDFPTVSIA